MPVIPITTVQEPSRSIFLTGENLIELGLETGDRANLKAGSSVTDAEIKASNEGNYISQGALTALGLPEVKELNLRQEKHKDLKIGPLIGILTNRSKRSRCPPYTSQNKLLHNFLSYSRYAKSLAYVFSPEEVDMANQTISGYFLDTDPGGTLIWKKHIFPLPDIVYDRIISRTFERKESTKRVISYLASENVKYFNPKFLNKWEIHTILSQHPILNQYLPETRKYNGLTNLIDFMDTYKTVYLKPGNGSLGLGIIRISRLPEGYFYQFRKGKKNVTGFWKTVDELNKALETQIKNKFYIMQQGLDLIKYQGRVFDIRVLMQKTGQGQWIDSAMVARIGAAGSIFPNVAAGGEPKNIEAVWQELTSADWNTSPTCTVTKQISLMAAEAVENTLGTFAELGLDIGTDGNGNVWIIEINSKPSRKVFPKDQPHLKKLSIRLPIDFATYLTGFAPDQERVFH